jgi:hypothetical protein
LKFSGKLIINTIFYLCQPTSSREVHQEDKKEGREREVLDLWQGGGIGCITERSVK